jgi:hypothetical protein
MAEEWSMPAADSMLNTGTKWLLLLLNTIPDEQRAPILMTIWRIWHAHNELTHDKPCPPIEGSRRFLVSYMNSLLQIKQYPEADVVKGKMVIDMNLGFKRNHTGAVVAQKVQQKWKPPDRGLAKLNVDGAFTVDGAGIGMVLRDSESDIIFTACRRVEHCRDATEVELLAIRDGIRLAMQWSSLQVLVESDCAEAIALIKEGTPNSSVYAFVIMEIRELLRERETTVRKISREINSVSHELAKLARVQGRTELWLSTCPPEVTSAVKSDLSGPV